MPKENINNNLINSDDEFSLRDLFYKIKESYYFIATKFKIIISISLICGIIGYFYAYNTTPLYIGVLTFTSESEQSSLSNKSSLASQIGLDLGSSNSSIYNGPALIELMKTRSIIHGTLLRTIDVNGQKQTLINYYIKVYNKRKQWEKDPIMKNIDFPINMNLDSIDKIHFIVLQEIYSEVTSNKVLSIDKKNKESSFNNVEFKSKDENLSILFCENLIKEVTDAYTKTKTKKARLSVEQLQKQTDSVRNELSKWITGVANLQGNTLNLNPTYLAKKTPQKKQEIELQANIVIFSQLIPSLEAAKVNLRKETPLIQILEHPISPLSISKPNSFLYAIFFFFVSMSSFIIYFLISRFIITFD
jgi:hypothetical protein